MPPVTSTAHARRTDDDGYVLICLVTGHGAEPDIGNASQRRRAAIQAAIVDALRHAAEIRDDFVSVENGMRSVALSPHLTLRCTEHGSRMTLEHDDHGRTHRIEVVDSRLTHPPLRDDLVHHLLEGATNEVRLVHTGPSSDHTSYQATLACYRNMPRPDHVTLPAADAVPATPATNPSVTTRRANPSPAPQRPIHVPEP